jgi:hypothetical protein
VARHRAGRHGSDQEHACASLASLTHCETARPFLQFFTLRRWCARRRRRTLRWLLRGRGPAWRCVCCACCRVDVAPATPRRPPSPPPREIEFTAGGRLRCCLLSCRRVAGRVGVAPCCAYAVQDYVVHLVSNTGACGTGQGCRGVVCGRVPSSSLRPARSLQRRPRSHCAVGAQHDIVLL